MKQSRLAAILLGLLLATAICHGANGQDESVTPFKHSLQLVEKGRYLELPPDVFNDFTEATVEAWVKWNSFTGSNHKRVFSYGGHFRDFSIGTDGGTDKLWFLIKSERGWFADVSDNFTMEFWAHPSLPRGENGRDHPGQIGQRYVLIPSLNGQVERIIQKGSHAPSDLLREIRSLFSKKS